MLTKRIIFELNKKFNLILHTKRHLVKFIFKRRIKDSFVKENRIFLKMTCPLEKIQ